MLSDKVAVISGADTYIGEAVSMRFAYEGAHVVLTAGDLDKLMALDNDIKQLGGKATLVQLDILDNNQVEEFAYLLNTTCKKVDIFVTTNLYHSNPNIIVDYSVLEWNKIIGVNLTVNWNFLRCFSPLFKVSPAARIIFTTIENFSSGKKFLSPYQVSKYALNKLVEEYTVENITNNIKANIIAIEHYIENLDVKAIPQPQEITDLFLRLASEKCLISGRKHYIQLGLGQTS